MNKPKSTNKLLTVKDYAKTRLSRRGLPVSEQYVYRLISESKQGLRRLDFEYVEIGNKRAIWIVK